MEVAEIVVCVLVAAAVLIVMLLTCIGCVQRRLDLDRQSMIMLRLFCALEALLVALAATVLPFPAFVVLHQLLLAYPGDILSNSRRYYTSVEEY
jgi:hypothetical protein